MPLLAYDFDARNSLERREHFFTSSQLNLQQLTFVESTDLIVRLYSRTCEMCSKRQSVRLDVAIKFGSWRFSRMPLGERRFPLESYVRITHLVPRLSLTLLPILTRQSSFDMGFIQKLAIG